MSAPLFFTALLYYFSKNFEISSRVLPFVSGRTNVATKKKATLHKAKNPKTVAIFVASTQTGNIEANEAETPWFTIIAIAIPFARIRVGISSVSASHTQTPGPKANPAAKI